MNPSVCLDLHAAHQAAPGLGVRHWHTGGSGSENVGHELVRGDGWNLPHLSPGCSALREPKLRQGDVARRIIAKADRIGCKTPKLADGFGRMGRRQQADAVRDDAGGEAHGEAVPVLAGIEHMPGRGQCCSEVCSIGNEARGADRAAAAVGDHVIRRTVGNQRDSVHGFKVGQRSRRGSGMRNGEWRRARSAGYGPDRLENARVLHVGQHAMAHQVLTDEHERHQRRRAKIGKNRPDRERRSRVEQQ